MAPFSRGRKGLDFKGKTVLVTGAASGIGREIALAFSRAGADTIVCDVNEAGLAETAGRARDSGRPGLVIEKKVDVSSRKQMRLFAEEVHRERGVVDILVNNAGVGLAGGFLDTTLDDWEWILSINLWGVIHGCHFFLPPMVQRGKGGHVVNVSSSAGFFASELLAAYSTTKFGVLGLSEALRDELRGHGIAVTTVCPGMINTPIVGATRLRGMHAAPGQQEKFVDLFRKRNYGPEKVASAVLGAVRKGQNGVLPVAPEAWALYTMKRLAPDLAPRVIEKLSDLTTKGA